MVDRNQNHDMTTKFDSRSVCILQTDQTLKESLSRAREEEQVKGEVSETIRDECRQVR